MANSRDESFVEFKGNENNSGYPWLLSRSRLSVSEGKIQVVNIVFWIIDDLSFREERFTPNKFQITALP